MGYCLLGKEKECDEAREKVMKKNKGVLPKELEQTTLDSCLYCSAFME